LTPQARRAITTDNYARLVLDARPRMRAFAQHVLTPAFVEQDLRSWEDGCSNYGERFDPAVLRAVRDAAYAGAGVDVDGRRLAGAAPHFVFPAPRFASARRVASRRRYRDGTADTARPIRE